MKIDFSRIEILSYITIILGVFLIILLDIAFFTRPSPSPPNRKDPDPTDTGPTQEYNFDPVEFGGFGGLLKLLLAIFVVAVGVLLVYGLYKMGHWYRNEYASNNESSKNVSENIKRVKDARSVAYEIIEYGLENGTYTSSFIQAYHALDSSLDFFRKLKRPKHWTPKEYAYTVSEPVFQPSVYKFVSVFYDLRYGMREGTRQNLLDFKQQLDFLFIEDVPAEIKNTWLSEYNTIVQQRKKYRIPRHLDLTKPEGGINK